MAATALEAPRFTGAMSAVVTDLATRFACDRVSLGIATRRRLRVRALSHSVELNDKTDLVKAITSAMDEALDQQQSVVVPRLPHSPGQISRAHEELSRRYGAMAICSVPLCAYGRTVGVLTFERGTDCPFDQATVRLCEAIAALISPALETKRRDDRWLFVKIWDAGGDQIGKLIGRGHLGLKLAALLIACAAGFLATATGDFRVTAKAVLEGEVQRAAVAPFQGYLDSAPVRAGDVVQAGQVLATLQDHDLKLEKLKKVSEREQLVKEYRKALAERDAPKVEILTAQLKQVQAQLDLATDKLARARAVAPFSGVVVTGDLSQQLGAPVEEGKVLFELAPLDAYRIVLQVDERDIGQVAVGQRGHLLLAALPHDVMPFTVEKITPVSTPRDGRNFFRVEGRF
ncbi:MAG TPA: HlyD family efflux transporter periplasmic adaptor subunit, partial [Blastocatellia bacterium]|nr:HlyD family efflux transporter periplasmic adaptor subunit [Blastocatellia bacterium]